MKNCFTYKAEDRALAENVARKMDVGYCAKLSKTKIARHQKMFLLEILHCFLEDD